MPILLGATTGMAVVYMDGTTSLVLLFPISRRDADGAWDCSGYSGDLNRWFGFFNAFVSDLYQEPTPIMHGTAAGITVFCMDGTFSFMLLFPISRRDAHDTWDYNGYCAYLNGWNRFYDACVSVLYQDTTLVLFGVATGLAAI